MTSTLSLAPGPGATRGPRPVAGTVGAGAGGALGGQARSFLQRNWLPCCALALLVASDYKVRVRPPASTLAGGVDAFVLAEVGIYGLVAAYLLLTQPRPPRVTRTEPLMFFTCAYVTMLVVSAGYSPFGSLAVVRALETVVLISLVSRMRSRATREDLHRLAHGFLGLVAASVFIGVAHPMPPVSRQQVGRFTWLEVHPIVSGVYLGLAVLIALVFVLDQAPDRPGPRWPRSWYAIVLSLDLFALLATKTRNAVLACAVGAVVLLWVRVRGRARVALTLGVLLLVGTATLAVGPLVTSYFARGEDAAQLATLNSRTSLWSDALHALQSQPLFGYGLSASRGIFLDATGLGGGHNAFINVAVDLGLVGLVLWLGVLACLVRTLFVAQVATDRRPASERALLLGVLSFLLVDGFFFEGMGAVSNVAANWLFFSVGWTLVLQRTDRPAAGDVRSVTRPVGQRPRAGAVGDDRAVA